MLEKLKIIEVEETLIFPGRPEKLYSGIYAQYEKSNWYRIDFQNGILHKICNCNTHRYLGEYLDTL